MLNSGKCENGRKVVDLPAKNNVKLAKPVVVFPFPNKLCFRPNKIVLSELLCYLLRVFIIFFFKILYFGKIFIKFSCNGAVFPYYLRRSFLQDTTSPHSLPCPRIFFKVRISILIVEIILTTSTEKITYQINGKSFVIHDSLGSFTFCVSLYYYLISISSTDSRCISPFLFIHQIKIFNKTHLLTKPDLAQEEARHMSTKIMPAKCCIYVL